MASKNKTARVPKGVQVIRVRKGATQREIQAAVRRAFTADDLAKFFEVDEETIPMEQVIARLEEIHREETQNLMKRRKGRTAAGRARHKRRSRGATRVGRLDPKASPGVDRMATKRQEDSPILRVRKGASLKEIYAAVRRTFTAAELARYAEIEEGIPAEEVHARLEAIQREETQRGKNQKHSKKKA